MERPTSVMVAFGNLAFAAGTLIGLDIGMSSVDKQRIEESVAYLAKYIAEMHTKGGDA